MDYDDESESDELLWVKAGEPGEKPTIIRQVRSDSSSGSSRDNSAGSTTSNSRKLCNVHNPALTFLSRNIDESTSSPDSRVIVVNVSEQVYPAVIDNHRIQKWKDLHSVHGNKTSNACSRERNTRVSTQSAQTALLNLKTSAQLSPPKTRCSPCIIRCASAEPKLCSREKLLKSRDEGYTSLSEDCKDSDSESVRSKSLPSSWKASHINKNGSEVSLHKYAQKIVSNNNSQCLLHNYNNDEVSISARRKLEKKKLRQNIEDTLETCTCILCVRSAIYHAQGEDDSDTLVDHPCSCSKPNLKCGVRWVAISVMVCFFPLLLCYPPFKCCLTIHDARTKRKKINKDRSLRQRTKQMNCKKTVL